MRPLKNRKMRIEKHIRAEKRLVSLLTAFVLLCSSFLFVTPVTGTEAVDAVQDSGLQNAQPAQEPLAAETLMPVAVDPALSAPAEQYATSPAASDQSAVQSTTNPAASGQNAVQPVQPTTDPAASGQSAV
ncbi:MAG: hypothetical protein J5973_00620 [Eubacterium sp.]|nr:hypothetical protein [Eubacterium sp.]